MGRKKGGTLYRMIILFQPMGIDWMGYKYSHYNPYTFHHIKEKRNGGKVTIDNGAILTKSAHRYLHSLENLCPDAYKDYQNLFKYINSQNGPLDCCLLEEIYGMLLDIEYYHIYEMKEKNFFNEPMKVDASKQLKLNYTNNH